MVLRALTLLSETVVRLTRPRGTRVPFGLMLCPTVSSSSAVVMRCSTRRQAKAGPAGLTIGLKQTGGRRMTREALWVAAGVDTTEFAREFHAAVQLP